MIEGFESPQLHPSEQGKRIVPLSIEYGANFSVATCGNGVSPGRVNAAGRNVAIEVSLVPFELRKRRFPNDFWMIFTIERRHPSGEIEW